MYVFPLGSTLFYHLRLKIKSVRIQKWISRKDPKRYLSLLGCRPECCLESSQKGSSQLSEVWSISLSDHPGVWD